MPHYRDDAIVLRTYKLGEADRILVLYTRTRGKVRAVAKGVRRTKSKFGARLDPASLVHLQLYEGRNLDTVSQAETIEVRDALRSDVGKWGRVAIVLEIVDNVAVEGEPNPALFKLLSGALSELERSGNPLVLPAFVARLLALEGVQPRLDQCVSCGATDELVAIDLHLGGVLCVNCRRGDLLSDAARTALRHVSDGRVRHVLDTTSPDVAAELEILAGKLIEQHIERRLKTVGVLHQQLHS
ncbi:MAG: DNA repair protein RecO [Acidimicrobiales bacterium]